MEIITERDQFVEFARRHGLRMDWHEPDEQNMIARVEGVTFDNAGFWPSGGTWVRVTTLELHVIFTVTDDDGKHPEDVAAVNLATLCAWATGYSSTPQL